MLGSSDGERVGLHNPIYRANRKHLVANMIVSGRNKRTHSARAAIVADEIGGGNYCQWISCVDVVEAVISVDLLGTAYLFTFFLTKFIPWYFA